MKHFSNSRTVPLLILSAVLTLAPAPAAFGQRGNQSNPAVLPPGSTPYGHTYGEWSARWWKWFLELPLDNHPVFGADCSSGQLGPVWFLWGSFTVPDTIICTVPPGKALFFPIINSECSNVEDPPFFGATPDQRLACAKSFMDGVVSLSATVDGVPVQNLEAYRFSSPNFSFTVPDNNLFGIPPGTSGEAVADGFYLMLHPLSAGSHTVHFSGTLADGFTIDTTFKLTVGK